MPTWFWGTGKTTTFANWITQVSSTKDGPLVHSVSYGQLEEETDAQSKDTFSTTVKKLGVQGISVLVSSGDDGVANSKGKYSKRRRSNVAVIIVRIVFISSFLFCCLLLNHSFQTNPNKITNCLKLFLSLFTTLQTTFAQCVCLFDF